MTTLVTGAASGIGRATALRLARRGATLVLVDIDGAGLEQTAALIGEPAVTRFEVVDVRHADRCAEVAGSVSGLTALAHCAGIVHGDARLGDLSSDAWDEILGVNLTGTANILRAVLPHLVAAGGGAAVLVSSIAALEGRRRIAAYSASKSGMIGLARAVVADYARDGVRVNCVCPGPVNTPLSAHLSTRKPWNAAGRTATPDEIAALVAWLLDDDAHWINGAVIPVDAAESAVYAGAFAPRADAAVSPASSWS